MSAKIRGFVKRLVGFTLLSAGSLTVFAYAVDYAFFRYRVAENRQAYGQVTVTNYDAVQQKSGKIEFLFNPPQTETCVNALFPHDGYTPCWYLRRHTEQRTNI